MFSVCMCARYQASPVESHFKIVKIILRYLNGTSHHILWLPKGSACRLVGFSDYDFAGCKLDRKALVVLVTCLETVSFLGTVKSIIALLFLPLMLNT